MAHLATKTGAASVQAIEASGMLLHLLWLGCLLLALLESTLKGARKPALGYADAFTFLIQPKEYAKTQFHY